MALVPCLGIIGLSSISSRLYVVAVAMEQLAVVGQVSAAV